MGGIQTGHMVRIVWDGSPRGTLICPFHGALPEGAEYTPGLALCGCLFVTLPGGILRAIRQAQSMAQNCRAGESELAVTLQTAAQIAG